MIFLNWVELKRARLPRVRRYFVFTARHEFGLTTIPKMQPLKGGVDKPQPADEAKVLFSAEKRQILLVKERGFINK